MMKPFLIDKISFKNNFLSYADHESIFGDGVGGEGDFSTGGGRG